MEDFLKDRPTLPSGETRILVASMPKQAGNEASPFARIVRDGLGEPANRPPAAATAKSAPVAAEHTTRVKTVVENGRVARIIVTCSCGKVTEIGCAY
jgi:hypothetical protein